MHTFHNVADATAAGIAVGSLLGYLPAVAAILSIGWTCIRIYEWWKGRMIDE